MCVLAPFYELFAVARLITGTGIMGTTLTAFVLSKYCHNMVPQLVFPQDIALWKAEQKVPKSVRWPSVLRVRSYLGNHEKLFVPK